MSNPYFSFKKFTVFHDKCAMKVGVDGVTLGAWCNVGCAKKILDVGTGSGLIAMMLAQRCDATITAIDVEEYCILQTKENVEKSPWKNQISVLYCSLQDFTKQSNEKFDLIVCNPPFFIDSLHSPSKERTTARHNNSLTHIDLIENSMQLLAENGRMCVILPVVEGNQLIEIAENNGLFCQRKVSVHPNQEKPAKRLLLEFGRFKCDLEESSLTIEQERHVYTSQYKELVKDFYLKL